MASPAEISQSCLNQVAEAPPPVGESFYGTCSPLFFLAETQEDRISTGRRDTDQIQPKKGQHNGEQGRDSQAVVGPL